jgi:hypothetical protein
MIQFQAKYLPALLAFKQKHGVRFYLDSIRIEPHPDGGAVLVATDGTRMMVIHDSQAVCAEAANITVRYDAARFCKGKSNIVTIDASDRLIVANEEGELYVQPGKATFEMKDLKYPEWRTVVPKFSELKTAVADYFAAGYIEAVVKAHPNYKKAGALMPGHVRFWQAGKNQCMAVEFAGHPEYLGIIMPIREVCDRQQTLPLWVKAFAPRPVAKAA